MERGQVTLPLPDLVSFSHGVSDVLIRAERREIDGRRFVLLPEATTEAILDTLKGLLERGRPSAHS
jgi:hypothetical protein